MTDLVARWRAFDKTLDQRDLSWGLHLAPPQLRYARSTRHRRGAVVDHLLPDDYRAFVAEIGYPVLGFSYYDREGFSFLPPEPMADRSADLPGPDGDFPEPTPDGPTVCTHAFFAGYDLSEIDGWAFGPDGGHTVVWTVEGGMPREVASGTFTGWLTDKLARLDILLDDLDDEDAAGLHAENAGEDDPHRLLDYSLGGSYTQQPYTDTDLTVHWVEDQNHDPYRYGLVDASGSWLIPMGDRFRAVRPFRDGAAEVVVNDPTTSHSGPWSTIRLH